MQFSPTRGCFSQMFKKQILKHSSKQIFWHPFCLWKTPPSRFCLFPPLCMPIFFKTFPSSDFWGVKKASCKKFHVFGENWQRNHFPKLTTFWLLLHPMLQLCHSALVAYVWLCDIVSLFPILQTKVIIFKSFFHCQYVLCFAQMVAPNWVKSINDFLKSFPWHTFTF